MRGRLNYPAAILQQKANNNLQQLHKKCSKDQNKIFHFEAAFTAGDYVFVGLLPLPTNDSVQIVDGNNLKTLTLPI